MNDKTYIIIVLIIVIINIKSHKKYNIYSNINIDKTHIQFSLTQIKQMLIYYYYANSKGLVSLISKKELLNDRLL